MGRDTRTLCATALLSGTALVVLPLVAMLCWQSVLGERLAFHQHHTEAFFLYAIIAPFYDGFLNVPHWTADMRNQALTHLDLKGTRKLDVVDVGAGTGFTTEGVMLALHNGTGSLHESTVTMLDQSPHQFEASSGKALLQSVERVVGDSHALPEAWSSRFDRYVSAGSIEYWPDPARALREAFRVVKPGGRAGVIGPVRAQSLLSRAMSDLWYLFPDEAEYKRWFQAAGFVDVECVPIMPYFVSPEDRIAHGLIMGFTVTGVKPMRAASSVPEPPLLVEASSMHQKQHGAASLFGTSGLRFLAGAYGATYYAVLPGYIWVRYHLGPVCSPLLDGLLGFLVGLCGWQFLIRPFLIVAEPWKSAPPKGALNLHALYQLARPHTIKGTVLASITGYALAAVYARSHAPLHLLRILVSGLFVNVYIVAVNQLTDVEIDVINKPFLPIAAGSISWQSASTVTGWCMILASTVSAMEGIGWFLTVQTLAWIGTVYSVPPLRLKCNAFGAALCISTSRAVVATVGGFYAFKRAFGLEFDGFPAEEMMLSFVVVLFVFTTVIAVMKDVPDIEGDRAAGVFTFATALGPFGVTVACVMALSLVYWGVCYMAMCQPFPVHSGFLLLSHSWGLLLLHTRALPQLARASVSADYTEIYIGTIWPLFYFEFLAFPGACLLQLLEHQGSSPPWLGEYACDPMTLGITLVVGGLLWLSGSSKWGGVRQLGSKVDQALAAKVVMKGITHHVWAENDAVLRTGVEQSALSLAPGVTLDSLQCEVVGVDIMELTEAGVQLVKLEVKGRIGAEIQSLTSVVGHQCGSSGKMVRSRTCMLLAQAFSVESSDRRFAVLAAATELIHNASLLHDDVVDGSDTRRGLPTAHKVYGNKLPILGGDFLMARALSALLEIGDERVVKESVKAVECLVNGEVLQMSKLKGFKGEPGLKEMWSVYEVRVFHKTAALFAHLCKAVGFLVSHNGDTDRVTQSLWHFGTHLGLAFQYQDDLLDFIADEESLGKPILQDVREGIVTAPCLYAAEEYPHLMPLLVRSLSNPGDAEEAIRCVRSSHGLQRTRDLVEKHTEKAIACLLATLPQGPPRSALIKLALQGISRAQ